MTHKPTLSVVLPNYNHAHFLPAALEAYFSQSYRPAEVIVMDDCSTDNSLEVLDDIARRQPLLRVLRKERNAGVVDSLTRMLRMISSDYVYMGSADDLVLPEFFAASMSMLARHPTAALCSARTRIINEEGRDVGGLGTGSFLPRGPVFLSPAAAREALERHGSWMFGNTAIFRRSALLSVELHQSLASYADGFAHEVLALRFGVCFVPRDLAAWRRMAGTYSDRIARNVEANAAIRDAAMALMRGVYRETFPETYVARWYGRWQYTMVQRFVKDVQQRAVEWTTHLVPRTTHERRFVGLARVVMRIARMLILAGAALTYRPRDILTHLRHRVFKLPEPA